MDASVDVPELRFLLSLSKMSSAVKDLLSAIMERPVCRSSNGSMDMFIISYLGYYLMNYHVEKSFLMP